MVVVVYRKNESSKKKYMKIFPNEQNPDAIINEKTRSPLIPHDYVIDEIGVGTSFIEKYKKQYRILKHEVKL